MKLWPKLLIVFISVMLVGSSIVVGLNNTISAPSGTTAGNILGMDMIRNSNSKVWTPTDDNLQAAIWDLNGTGCGKVYLPAVDIVVDRVITIARSDVELVGIYGESTLELQGNIAAVLHLDGSASRIVRITISGIEFKTQNYAKGFDGIFIDADEVSQLTIDHCYLRGAKEEAIHLDECWNSRISYCYFQENGENTTNKPTINFTRSGSDKSTNPKILYNNFEYGEWVEIYNEDSYAYRCQIIGNYFEGVGGSPSYAFIKWDGHYGEIRGNTVYREIAGLGRGITGYGAECTVNDNHITNCNYGIDWWGARTRISNNHVDTCYYRGIQTTADCVISGNFVDTCGDPSNANRVGIRVNNNCTVSNNYINGGVNSFRAISTAQDCSLITGNKIQGGAAVAIGILVEATGELNYITDNYLFGTFTNTELSIAADNNSTGNSVQGVIT